MRYDYHPGDSLALHVQHDVRWRLHFSPRKHKVFFHPLRTSGGADLTGFRPSDHPWHYGLWFAWKFINGVNYWEENADDTVQGVVAPVGPERVTLEADRAVIELTLHYRPGAEASPVLVEHRRIVVREPEADGSYSIDWSAKWRAMETVTLDRTPPEKFNWGGYSGMSWRAARSMQKFKFITSEGGQGREADRQHARWAAMSALVDGGHQRHAGVALLDHPSNPRHPPRWYQFDSDPVGYLGAAIIHDQPLTLEAHEELALRYRVILHDGATDPMKLEDRWRSFAAE